jgi:hypothetical protein
MTYLAATLCESLETHQAYRDLDAALQWERRLSLQKTLHTSSEICDCYSLQPLPDARTVQFMQVDAYGW